MSDKAAGQKTRSPEGCDENGPAAASLLSHVSIQICSFAPPASLRETLRVTMWAGLREALRAGRALPAAHFDRNATTPVTELVH
jgi:hypothetical protein